IVDSGYLVDQHDALESHRLAGLTVRIGPQTIRSYRRTTPYDTLSRHDRHSFAHLTAQTFSVIPAGYASVAAGVDSLFGWHAVDTQTAFLGVLLIVAGLGGFAFALHMTGSLLAALLAALLFAGPLGFQLYVDSAEGSRSGVSLVAPIMLVGALLLSRGSRPALVFLFGLLLA